MTLKRERDTVIICAMMLIIFKTLKAFPFTRCDEVRGRAMQRQGARMSQLCSYKMLTRSESLQFMSEDTSAIERRRWSSPHAPLEHIRCAGLVAVPSGKEELDDRRDLLRSRGPWEGEGLV
jgi:hypothetical protein